MPNLKFVFKPVSIIYGRQVGLYANRNIWDLQIPFISDSKCTQTCPNKHRKYLANKLNFGKSFTLRKVLSFYL